MKLFVILVALHAGGDRIPLADFDTAHACKRAAQNFAAATLAPNVKYQCAEKGT